MLNYYPVPSTEGGRRVLAPAPLCGLLRAGERAERAAGHGCREGAGWGSRFPAHESARRAAAARAAAATGARGLSPACGRRGGHGAAPPCPSRESGGLGPAREVCVRVSSFPAVWGEIPRGVCALLPCISRSPEPRLLLRNSQACPGSGRC